MHLEKMDEKPWLQDIYPLVNHMGEQLLLSYPPKKGTLASSSALIIYLFLYLDFSRSLSYLYSWLMLSDLIISTRWLIIQKKLEEVNLDIQIGVYYCTNNL